MPSSPQNVDFSEYYSLLTYYGILPTGMLSETDLDYLVFRLKIFSTSPNADSAHAPLFQLHTPQHAPSTSKTSQPFPTVPLVDTTTTTPPTTCFDTWPDAGLCDSMKVHTCNFFDELSPCWNRQCELWEGINDGQSWLWQEDSLDVYSDHVTTTDILKDESQVEKIIDGSVPFEGC